VPIFHDLTDIFIHLLNIRVSLIEHLAGIDRVYLEAAESLEGTPERGVLLQRVLVHLNGLASFQLPLVHLPKQEETRSAVGDLRQQVLL